MLVEEYTLPSLAVYGWPFMFQFHGRILAVIVSSCLPLSSVVNQPICLYVHSVPKNDKLVFWQYLSIHMAKFKK